MEEYYPLELNLFSWVEENFTKCYQKIKSESVEKLQEWIDNWKDLVDFDVIPVINSEEASKIAIQKYKGNLEKIKY